MQAIAPNGCRIFLNLTMAPSCESWNLQNKHGSYFGSKLLKGPFQFNPIRRDLNPDYPSNAKCIAMLELLQTSTIAYK